MGWPLRAALPLNVPSAGSRRRPFQLGEAPSPPPADGCAARSPPAAMRSSRRFRPLSYRSSKRFGRPGAIGHRPSTKSCAVTPSIPASRRSAQPGQRLKGFEQHGRDSPVRRSAAGPRLAPWRSAAGTGMPTRSGFSCIRRNVVGPSISASHIHQDGSGKGLLLAAARRPSAPVAGGHDLPAGRVASSREGRRPRDMSSSSSMIRIGAWPATLSYLSGRLARWLCCPPWTVPVLLFSTRPSSASRRLSLLRLCTSPGLAHQHRPLAGRTSR